MGGRVCVTNRLLKLEGFARKDGKQGRWQLNSIVQFGQSVTRFRNGNSPRKMTFKCPHCGGWHEAHQRCVESRRRISMVEKMLIGVFVAALTVGLIWMIL